MILAFHEVLKAESGFTSRTSSLSLGEPEIKYCYAWGLCNCFGVKMIIIVLYYLILFIWPDDVVSYV